MAFQAPGAANAIHTEDDQRFISRDGRWAKTPFSKGFAMADRSGQTTSAISASMDSPASNFIRASATVQMTSRSNMMFRLFNSAQGIINLSTTKVLQRWGQLSWTSGGQGVTDWNGQLALSTGVALNGTRQGGGVVENQPLDLELKLMTLAPAITAMRMRTLYHSTYDNAQLVNCVFYLEHPITDIGKVEVRRAVGNGTWTIGTIALEWW